MRLANFERGFKNSRGMILKQVKSKVSFFTHYQLSGFEYLFSMYLKSLSLSLLESVRRGLTGTDRC